MKKILLIATAITITLISCKKDSADPIPGCTDSTAINFNPSATINDSNCIYPVNTNLTIDFTQTINGANLILGSGCLDGEECLPEHSCCAGTLPYTNNEGQVYNIKRLWYIISDITLHSEDSTNHVVEEVHFIDVNDPTTLSLMVSDLGDNHYVSISYTMGLNAARNISNMYVNEDFHDNMIWPEMMGGGYHYMKLEGNFNNDSTFYNTHTGGTMGYDYSFNNNDIISLITNETISEVKISINMEVNNWYKNPNSITLSTDGIMGNMQMQTQLKANGADVFNTTTN